jgi:hypothetical protein
LLKDRANEHPVRCRLSGCGLCCRCYHWSGCSVTPCRGRRNETGRSPKQTPKPVIFKNGVQIASHHLSLIATTPPFLTSLPPPKHRKPHGVAINNKLPRRGGAPGPRGCPLRADAGLQGRCESKQGRSGMGEPWPTDRPIFWVVSIPQHGANSGAFQGIGAYRDDNAKPWVLPVVKKVRLWLSAATHPVHSLP